jgi:nicotinamidase-related amidase
VVWVRVNLKQFIQLPVDEPSPLAGKPLPDELSEIVRSAGFQDGDLLVTKRHWGAFAGTSLEPELRSRGIDTVVLTGISTNGGQGTGLGFAFVVVEDACSGQDAEEHRFAFERIFPRLARVRTVDEVLKALA